MLPGAVASTGMPAFIPPCLPTTCSGVPKGDCWVHEIKLDGYRIQARLKAGMPSLLTRSGLDWTHRFGAIAEALMDIPANDLILDGVIIVPDGHSASEYNALTNALYVGGNSADMLYYAFDLLYHDGFDVRAAPLLARKSVPAKLIGTEHSPILISDHLEIDGARMFAEACKMGLEGIVSKLADSPYRSGRSDTWIKVNCIQCEAFPIVGFVPDGTRSLAALYLAKRVGRGLIYVGKAGTGFTVKSAEDLRKQLDLLVVAAAALRIPVRKPKAIWVKPDLLADIEFRAVTSAGLLRAATFKGVARQ